MADNAPQSYANHSKVVPGFHYVTFGLLALYLVWCVRRLWYVPQPGNVMPILLALAIIIGFFYLRVMVLSVQDRVIRLEMRLRLRELLAPELAARIGELKTGHLVALRFA